MPQHLTHIFTQIADGLADRGYADVAQFLQPEEASAILQTDEFVNHKLHFRKAGVGKTDNRIHENIRGDYIQWIDPVTAPAAEQVYLTRLRDLLSFLNQNLFLSLKDIEIHRTVYPAGARYERHVDQFRQDDHRKLSIICYLNADWKESEGGQLVLYLGKESLSILPHLGRLICFRSDLLEHEVLPSTRERYSLTGWAVDQLPELR